MQIICQQDLLYEALSAVTHALTSKTPIPALECVHLMAKDRRLTLTCSDLHLTISCDVPAEIEDGEGGVLLPGRLFSEIIRKMPAGDVTLTINTNFVTRISSGDTRTTVSGQPPENFPAMPSLPDADHSASMSQTAFKAVVREVAFAAATDEVRPVLTGCLMRIQGGRLTVVALDTFRMALRRAALLSAKEDFEAIVPARYLSEITKILPDTDDEITLNFGGSYMMVDLGAVHIAVRLLDGQFIKYEQLIPTGGETRVRFDKGILSDCVERAALIAREGKGNLMRMEIASSQMVVTSNNEAGDVYERLDCEQYGKDITIAFNVRYLSDVLRNLNEDRLMMVFTSPVSPCVVVPEEGDQFLYLVLPVRVH